MINIPLSKIKDIFRMNSLEDIRKQANGFVKNKDKSDFLEIYRSYQEVKLEACKHAVSP